MKINEIRIGNFLKVPDRKRGGFPPSKIGVVSGILNGSIYIDGNLNDTYLILTVNPIQLTEELLCKCPIFHKSHNEQGNTFHVLKDGWDVLHTIEHWTETENPKYKGRFHWDGIGEVKYLHEVQNWYYMFMKKELEINL